MRRTRSVNPRSGFTILELLVSISILALLAAIIIPAVQSARGSARKLSCRNNLRQVGVALQQYVTTFRQFPKTRSATGSSFVSLLPWLDQARLYSSIIEANKTGKQRAYAQPGVFVCPEDPVAVSRRRATSIGENVGICVSEKKKETPVGREYDGIFLTNMQPQVVRPAGVTDGMSNTACYAEIVGYPRPDRRRMVYSFSSDGMRCRAVKELASHCRMADKAHPSNGPIRRGSDWIHGGLQLNQYQHVLPPNERECLFIPNAASEHGAGAHTAMCDGSVKFVSSSVDDAVWQAVGSRNGAEPISQF